MENCRVHICLQQNQQHVHLSRYAPADKENKSIAGNGLSNVHNKINVLLKNKKYSQIPSNQRQLNRKSQI